MSLAVKSPHLRAPWCAQPPLQQPAGVVDRDSLKPRACHQHDRVLALPLKHSRIRSPGSTRAAPSATICSSLAATPDIDVPEKGWRQAYSSQTTSGPPRIGIGQVCAETCAAMRATACGRDAGSEPPDLPGGMAHAIRALNNDCGNHTASEPAHLVHQDRSQCPPGSVLRLAAFIASDSPAFPVAGPKRRSCTRE